jgi:hypothetical protein
MLGRIHRWPRLLVLAAISPVALSAQTTDPELLESDWIRIHTAGIRTPLVGRFVGYDGVVLLVDAREGDLTRVALDRVDQLERRVARETLGFWNGALIGAGGTLLGGLVLQAFGDPGNGANLAMAGAAVLAVPIGLVGGVVGSSISRETWEEVAVLRPPGP